MSTVSVLTGVTRPAYLPALYDSLRSQTVAWEWLVQLDEDAIRWSPGPADDTYLRDDRVRVERNDHPAGSGTTRNQALLRSCGEFVLCVDDDDLLYPDSVAELCRALEQWPDCFGAWGRTDLLHDRDPAAAGAQVFKSWHRAGPIPPGTILRHFEQTGQFPVHVGATLWRRSHLVAVGGYSALPRSIDTTPFLAAEALFPSCYVDTPVYRYRMHAQQMTREQRYQDVKQRVHAFAFQRAHELRRLLRPSDQAG